MTEPESLEQFERFWGMYPRKVSKGAARKTWLKLVKGYSLEDCRDFTEMLWRSLDAQKREAEKRRKDGDFTPDWKHPATWLNSECWLDDVHDQKDKPKTILGKCNIQGCDEEVMGQRFEVCATHFSRAHDQYRETKRDFMTRHNLLPSKSESSTDYAARCREKCHVFLNILKGRVAKE